MYASGMTTRINEFSKVARYEIIHKYLLYFYTLAMNSTKRKLRKQFLLCNKILSQGGGRLMHWEL